MNLLKTLDSIATTNGGAVKLNGFDYIAISREDWQALMALRGSDEDVLSRLAPVNEGRDHTPCDPEASFAAARALGFPV